MYTFLFTESHHKVRFSVAPSLIFERREITKVFKKGKLPVGDFEIIIELPFTLISNLWTLKVFFHSSIFCI